MAARKKGRINIFEACRAKGRDMAKAANSLQAKLPRWRGVCVICLALWTILLAAVIGVYLSSREAPEEIKIAFVAREVNDPSLTLNKKTEYALRYYLDELEKLRPEWRFTLEPFEVNSVNTAATWTEIANDPSYAFVIDNAWGENMIQASSIIRRDELPVIALNADRLSAGPGEQALFLGHGDLYPKFIAHFVKEILGHDRVHLVKDKGYSLNTYLEEALIGQEIEISQDHPVSGVPTSSNALELLKLLSAEPDIPIILNTHHKWGEFILQTAESGPSIGGLTFIGPPAIISSADMNEFGIDGSGNQLYFLADPVDALTHKVTTDLLKFKEETDFWTVSSSDPQYVKRCLDAVEILRTALDHPPAPPEKSPQGDENTLLSKRQTQQMARRTGLANALASLNGDILRGSDDLYTFDDRSRIVHEATFVHHANGVRKSHPLQLNSEYAPISNIVVGIELLDVSDLDPTANSFKTDFLYWTVEPIQREEKPKKQEDDKNEKDEDLQGKCKHAKSDECHENSSPIFFRNLKQEFSQRLLLDRKIGSCDPAPDIAGSLETTPSSTTPCLRYRRYQVSGDFHHSFALADFPLDKQEPALQISIVNPSEKVRISFDPSMLDQYRNKSSAKGLSIPGWSSTRAPYPTVENRVTSDLRGDPALAKNRYHKFKTLYFWIPLKRDWSSQFFVIALPLISIGLISLFLLFSPTTAYDRIGDVAVGTFLSIITYSIAYTQLTPASNVLTKADHLFYGTFIIVVATFVWIILSNVVNNTDRSGEGPVERRFRAVRILLLVGYIAWVALIPSL